jgi:hypothetical protein
VFVFVVESGVDPANAAIAGLMRQQGALCLQHQQLAQHGSSALGHQHWPPGVLSVWRQQQELQQQQGAAGRLVVVAQAGLALTCSQKIHK